MTKESKQETLTKDKTIITQETDPRKLKEKKIEELREKDSTPVRGIFRNLEVKGAPLTFSFRKYKKDPVQTYTLQDENIYTLPLGVVKHLNNDCWYPQHEHTVTADGKPAISIKKKVRRFSFSPLDFVDESEFRDPKKDLVIASPIR